MPSLPNVKLNQTNFKKEKMFKGYLLFGLLLTSFIAVGQQKNDSLIIVGKIKELHEAVFVNKDSIALEKLLAPNISYGHSGGKIENRKETISNISASKSVYTNTSVTNETAQIAGNTAVGRYLFVATETNKDGKITNLKLHILTVWTKVKGKWLLIARQAAKV